jgi:hypothetical protein
VDETGLGLCPVAEFGINKFITFGPCYQNVNRSISTVNMVIHVN